MIPTFVSVGRSTTTSNKHDRLHQQPQQQQLLWPCVGIIPRAVLVSIFHMFQMGLLERVRRLPLLQGSASPSSKTKTILMSLSSSSTSTAKLHNRYQKELHRLLSSGSSTSSSRASSSSPSSPPWNQDALLQLVQLHPNVCKVMYDFTFHEIKNVEDDECNDDDDQQAMKMIQQADHTFADHQRHQGSTWCQYPLWRILQMAPLPSLPLLQAVYQAYPTAIFQTDPMGNSILHSLCSHAKAPSSRHHSNNSNSNSNSASSLSSTTNVLDLMRYLIKQEPLLVQMVSTSSGATPLHVAVRFGTSMDVVQLLVDAYPAAMYATTLASGETPLHWACQNTHLSFVSAVVPYLLQQQQKLSSSSAAAAAAQEESTNLLLATNQRGESCLHILLQHHRQAAPAPGSTSCATPTRHVRASTRIFISILQIMLDQDDSNTLMSLPDILGRVPLHLALSFGCYPLEVIQFLVQQHPQTLWVRDLSGFTPVHRACLYPAHLEILTYVLQVKLNTVAPTASSLSNPTSDPIKKHVDGSDDDDSTKRTASITSGSSSPPASPSSSMNSSTGRPTVQITATLMSGVLQAPINSQDTEDTEDTSDSPNAPTDNVQELVQSPPPPPPSENISSIFRVKQGNDAADMSLPTPLLRLQTRSGALPLHVACEFWTSLAIVQTLVKQDRQALGLVDEQGCTPLHLACASRAPYDLLQYLVQQYPKALLMEDHQGRLPLHVTLETIPQRGHSLHPPSSTVVELMLGRELLLLLGQEEDRDIRTDDDESCDDQATARHDSIRKANTLQGETGFDIATRHNAPGHILALLVPGGPLEGKGDRAALLQATDHRFYGEQIHTPPVQQIHVPTTKEIMVPMSWQDDWMLGDDTAGHDWEDLYQRVEI